MLQQAKVKSERIMAPVNPGADSFFEINTSFSPKNEIMKVANAMIPAVAHGRKYGCCRIYSIRPKVSGHLVARSERLPPIIGLSKKKGLVLTRRSEMRVLMCIPKR